MASKAGGAKKVKSRQDRQKERAEIDKNERKKAIMSIAEEAGLGYIEHEIPPDEVDEAEVRRTILTSLRSMIPYTNEWYEANAAEEELDNLSKIRIEKVRASDLLAQARMGQHEDALEQMMSETNYDFFYFNKLKLKREEEGKWNFEEINLNPFKHLEAGEGKNRLKKAGNAHFSLMDEKLTAALAKLSSVEGPMAAAKPAQETMIRKDMPCAWRGKNKAGEPLKCNNLRIVQTMEEKEKASKPNNPFCTFHSKFCISREHLPEECVPILAPNVDSLCMECHMQVHGKKPATMTLDGVPGVAPTEMVGMVKRGPIESKIQLRDDPAGDAAERKLNKQIKNKNKKAKKVRLDGSTGATTVALCEWEPDKNDEETRTYECGNPAYLDKATEFLYPCCAYHLKECVRSHPPNSTNHFISLPNAHGLCIMHYLAEFNEQPPVVTFPFPGMVKRKQADFWKNMAGRHWATPQVGPKPDIQLKRYEPPEEPEDALDYLINAYKYVKFFMRRRKLGLQSAIIIQRNFRRFRVHNTHKPFVRARKRAKRLAAILRIQAQMRRFLGARRFEEVRILYNAKATDIQRLYRGYYKRMELLIDWAAKRIQRFMKHLHFFKFRDAVIMVMQIRLLVKKKHLCARTIQRYYRGYTAKCLVFNMKMWAVISTSRARMIQRCYIEYKKRMALRGRVVPGEDWALKQCGKRLAFMILEMYIDRTRRQELAAMMHASAPSMQRLIRGFLARAGAKKMAYIRNAIRTWCRPQFAVDFLGKYLDARVYRMHKSPGDGEDHQQQLVVRRNRLGIAVDKEFVRPFLPEDKRNKLEVDKRVFEEALTSYYASENLPLLLSEKNAILKRFRNPMNGTVNVSAVEEYIGLHTLPCKRHGRKVCGTCVFREECLLKSCRCTLFQSHPKINSSNSSNNNKSKQGSGGICLHCDHPGTLHALLPLQLRGLNFNTQEQQQQPQQQPKKGKSALLLVDNQERDPDLSLPVGVVGVHLEDVIITPLDADDKRLQATQRKEERKEQRRAERLERSRNGLLPVAGKEPPLTQQIARLQVGGDSTAENVEYWGQYASDLFAPAPTRAPPPRSTSTSTSMLAVARTKLSSRGTADDGTTSSNKRGLEGTNTVQGATNAGRTSAAVGKGGIGIEGPSKAALDLTVKVANDYHAPNMQISQEVFWTMTAKNPNKTTRDYNEKFEHNVPMPVVRNGTIVYTFEGAKLYFNIVNHIIKLEKLVHHDDPTFLKLVTEHIQIFERHWRKMVADIRTGSLDRNLFIAQEDRMIFESTNIPRPALARRLDKTFRELGFHKKVLGKDIKIQPYAQLKKRVSETGLIVDRGTSLAAVKPPLQRKYSNPTTPSFSRRGEIESNNNNNSSRGRRGGPGGGEVPSDRTTTAIDSNSAKSSTIVAGNGQKLEPAAHKKQAIGKSLFSQSLTIDTSTVEGQLVEISTQMGDKSARNSGIGQEGRSFSTTRSQGGGGGEGGKSRSSTPSAGGRTSRNGSSKSRREKLAALGQSFKSNTPKTPGNELPNSGWAINLGTSTLMLPLASSPSSRGSGSRGGHGGAVVVVNNSSAAVESAVSGRRGRGSGAAGTTTTTITTTTTTATMEQRPQLKRRGSDSKLLNPPSDVEIDTMHYALDTAPRHKDSYQVALQSDGDRFVCPFPACGRSFHSKEAAFRHLPLHEQRERLYAPTPLPDSHMRFYWPEGTPWLEMPKYTMRALPPGGFKCTSKGCKEAFRTRSKLENHLRLVHLKIGSSSLDQGYFRFPRAPLCIVPPAALPSMCPELQFCPLHVIPAGKCHTCVQIESKFGPKPPFRFYESVVIDVDARAELDSERGESGSGFAKKKKKKVTHLANGGLIPVGRSNSKEGGGRSADDVDEIDSTLKDSEIRIVANSWEREEGVFVRTGGGENEGGEKDFEWKGHVLAVILDRNNNGWVAVQRVVGGYEATLRGIHLPHDFDPHYEVCELPASAVACKEIVALGRDDMKGAYLQGGARERGGKVISGSRSGGLGGSEVEGKAQGTNSIEWVPVHDIQCTFILRRRDRFEVSAMLADPKISKINTFYLRVV